MNWEDLLGDIDSIIKAYLYRHGGNTLLFEEEVKKIEEAYTSLADKAATLDPTLATSIMAEKTKQLKQFEQLGSRMLRAEKQHQDTNIKRIQKLKEKLFPQGKLQERFENFFSFYSQSGPQLIDDLITICDPMDERFKVAILE